MKEIQKKGLAIAAVVFGILWILILSEIDSPSLAEGQAGVPWNWWGFVGLTGVSVLYAGCSFLIYRLSIVEHVALFLWLLCFNCWEAVSESAYALWEKKHEIRFCTEHGLHPLSIALWMIALVYLGFCVYSFFQDRENYLIRNALAVVMLFFGAVNYRVKTYGSEWFFVLGLVYLFLMITLRLGIEIRESRQPNVYVDTHTHYFLKQIVNKKERLLQEAKDKGVKRFVSVSISKESIEEQKRLFAEDDSFCFAVGLHPSFVKASADVKWVQESLIKYMDERTAAVGETGLDYHREDTTEEEKKWQQACFRAHIQLAVERNLPLILHIRDKDNESFALKDGLSILKEFTLRPEAGVFHCFHYGKEQEALVKQYLKLGFFFGIGGKLCDRKDESFRKMVRWIPLDRLVLETDCPYVKPEGMSGKVNSSAAIPVIARELAQLKRQRLQEIAACTTFNADRLFVWEERQKLRAKAKAVAK